MMGDSELKEPPEPPVDERFVGEGEVTALKILKSIFGETECEYKIQYLFKKLMSENFANTLSERQERETLDIVIFRVKDKTIVVRVQDKHHDSILKTSQDIVQKQMLEWNGCVVVDLWYKECPTVWSEEINEESFEEVTSYLRKAKLI